MELQINVELGFDEERQQFFLADFTAEVDPAAKEGEKKKSNGRKQARTVTPKHPPLAGTEE